MIDRFNFYDVYGYLLPGMGLLLALGAPFVLAGGREVDVEVSAAIVGSVVAYFAGHLLQAVSREALPSKRRDSSGKARLNSSIMLDADEPTFPEAFRQKLLGRIHALGVETATDDDRLTAFEACRQRLQAAGVTSYAEQFQGMYAMMRGLCMACLLGLAFAAGWAGGAWLNAGERVLFALNAGVTTAAAAYLVVWPRAGACFWMAWAAAFTNGLLLGVVRTTEAHAIVRLLGLSLLLAVAARFFFQSNKAFADRFAKTVYTSFYLHAEPERPAPRLPRRK